MAATDNPPPKRDSSRTDLFAGAIFIAIAVVFGWNATGYEMGRLIAMGPGFVPLALSIMLGGLGVALTVFGREEEADATGPVPWRGMILACASLVLFGAYCREIGLLPAVFVCSFLTALASRQNSIVSAIWIAGALSLLCWLVFKIGLGLTLPLIGPAFGPYQVY